MNERTRTLIGLAAAGAFLGAHAALGGLRGDHLGLALAGGLAWSATGRWRSVAALGAPLLILFGGSFDPPHIQFEQETRRV